MPRETSDQRDPARRPFVWLLMGNRAGDNNQLLALAEALDWPFEAKHIDFNWLRHVPSLRKGLTILAAGSRSLVKPPWPDLVIAVGYGSVPVARHIRAQTGGRAKLVHIGNPRDRLNDFDLQLTTPQYSRGSSPNLLELPFAIGNPAQNAHPDIEELEWLRRFSKPRRLIAVGGPARYWELDEKALVETIHSIRGKRPSGSIIAATSKRTRRKTRQLLKAVLSGENEEVVEHFPSFSTLLAECDEVYVTADSVSMLSEAIVGGKPTGMIPIRRSLRGKLTGWLWEKPFGKAAFPDLANFWALLRRHRLIGTVDLPVVAQVCDTVEQAANAVRSLFAPGDVVDQDRSLPDPHLGIARRARGRQRPDPRTGRDHRAAVRNEATGI